jgi:hypothetical protein
MNRAPIGLGALFIVALISAFRQQHVASCRAKLGQTISYHNPVSLSSSTPRNSSPPSVFASAETSVERVYTDDGDPGWNAPTELS